MISGLHIFPDEPKLDIIRLRYVAAAISAVLLLGSLGLAFTKGLNFGIDFLGGSMVEVRFPQAPDLTELRERLGALGLGDVSLQQFGEPEDVLIRIPRQPGEEEAQMAALAEVRAALGEEVDYRRTEVVGPTVGAELIQAGTLAVLLSLSGILLYIWFRFEWHYGLAAVAALTHDVIATIGLFAFTQLEFGLSTVAAVLLIAGYSINDTVVVFDRVREKFRKYKSLPVKEVLNLAINKTLSRTLVTSITTLLALGALYFFGGEVLQSFILAMIWGVVIGTYSSIFIAVPMLLFFRIRREDAAAQPVGGREGEVESPEPTPEAGR